VSKLLSTEVLEGKNASLVVDQAELRVIAGPDRGLKALLGADSIVIGSSPHCDLVLHDGTVSGRHAEIQSTTRGFFVRDLGSTNGVVCGDQPIDRAPLCDAMKIGLGETTLKVQALGSRLTIPLGRAGRVGQLIALSVKMRAFTEQLAQAAGSGATVLIEGESGTG
jgi:pSer/pThr/pTyr-binding forkhead associated (FHA) protein